MIRNHISLGIFLCCFIGCQGQSEADDPHLTDTTRLTEERPSESITMPLTSISREDLENTLALGLSKFLRQVRIKAFLRQGKFVGWEIIAFRDPSSWRGVGLLVGDVITQVNQQEIERDTQAFKVFMSLKQAELIEVEYLRREQKMLLSLPIIGKPIKRSPAKTAPSIPPGD